MPTPSPITTKIVKLSDMPPRPVISEKGNRRAHLLFKDCSMLTEEDAKWIRSELIGYGFFAFIDYCEAHGAWIFHTLCSQGMKWEKPGLRKLFPKQSNNQEEKAVEDAFCAELIKRGTPFKRQLKVSGGIADIVTADTLIEVKVWLDRSSCKEAIGQLFFYNLELERSSLMIAGKKTPETALVSAACKSAGIALWIL